ncbi:SHOCT domain-containing protein [Streptacidiphilus sp. MAP5-3]|uniref:SHOCT domain-containing protein n=1 Tax=unclassified Streptacidiphilus TaxID=2643834 RepID=UPI003512D7C2
MTQPQPQLPIVVKGNLGEIRFDGWTVTIHHSMPGIPDGSIPIDQLTGVELKSANVVQSGLITLLVAGTVAPRRRMAARANPLALQFWPGQTKRFEELRNVLLAAIATRRAPQQPAAYGQPQHPAPNAFPTPPAASLTDELQRLGHMVQQGLLTPEQFEQAKQQLLGGPRY